MEEFEEESLATGNEILVKEERGDSDGADAAFNVNVPLMRSSQRRPHRSTHQSELWAVSVSADGQWVVNGGKDQTVKVWSMETRKCVSILEGHQGIVWSVSISLDGEWIVSGSADNTVKVWNRLSGECVRTLEGHQGWVTSVITADGRRIVSGSRDQTLKVWNMSTGECLSTLEGHQGAIRSVSVSADGQKIVSGSYDRTVKVWRISTGECLLTLEGHRHYVTSVSVAANGQYIASGSQDKTLKVWNMSTGECSLTLEGHRDYVLSVCVTADGQRTVSGSLDNTVKVWSTSTGECVSTLEGHHGAVTTVSITADGEKIVSGSHDETMKVWSMSTGECLFTFEAPEDRAISKVPVTIEDQRLMNDSKDDPMKEWGIVGLPPAKKSVRARIEQATALNDNAKGIDRFGYSAYAKALYSMLDRASPPICVGLFAKWGSGKSFMMHLLKQEFDPKCEEDPNTFELIQWFDPRYTGRHPNVKEPPRNCFTRCSMCIKVLSKWFGTDSNSLSYSTLAWLLLMNDLFKEFHQDLLSIYFGGYQPLPSGLSAASSSPKFHFKSGSSVSVSPAEDDHDEEKGLAAPTGLAVAAEEIKEEEKIRKSYIFVDFNAWEFNKSDQLWVGLIRNIYATVERRLEVHRDKSGVAVDFKRLWRAEKAKEEVIRSYGGIKALRLRVLLLVFCCLVLVVCIVLAFCYLGKLIRFFRSNRSGGVVSILTFLLFFGGTLYPIIEMVFRTGKETHTSQGDRIYNEAADGRDKLGFLRHVREELDELFKFLVETYQEKTGESLTLVIFIDDLDRCVGQGRIVAVLEALQLLLNIPGAPVIAFLAVDSRIIASSIETTLNQSVDLQDTPVTGWEYLDKIIQVPFCLPPPPPQKIQRMLTSSLAGRDIALPVVANRLRDLMTQLQMRQEILGTVHSPSIGFLEEEDEAKQSRYHPVPQFLSSLRPFKEDDESLVCNAARSVLSNYAANVEARSRGLEKKERLEMLCRSINFCLYHFDFDFEIPSETVPSSPPAAPSSAPFPPPSSLPSRSNDKRKKPADHDHDHHAQEDPEEHSPLKKKNILDKYKLIIRQISSSSRPPLVQPEVLTALNEISLYLDPNPRKLKRLANILQLVTEVAKHKPISEAANQNQKLSKEPQWGVFSLKIVKWIGLCECYPFRTSLLVQILEDMDQKKTYGVRNPNGLLHYEGVSGIDFESMTLVEFYFEFVARLIRVVPEFKKLHRLDSDPELFVSYLSLPLSGLPAANGDIVSSDVLGPIIDSKKRLRDLNFSLLSHSFNLNPAMRGVIALEVQSDLRRSAFALSRRENPESGERARGREDRGRRNRWEAEGREERGRDQGRYGR
jgi:WD40 repeat protein